METLLYIIIFLYLISSISYGLYLVRQQDRLFRIGFGILLVGFVLHSILVGYEFAKSGHIPVNNLHQTLTIAGLAIAGAFFVFQYKFNFKVLGIYVAPMLTFIMALSSQTPREPEQIHTIIKSAWVVFHVVIIFLGEASFALACGLGILYLLQEHAIKNKSRGFFFRRLPSLDFLDSTGYACIVAGFTLLTVGLISGFIYAKAVWGRFWSWDPKEVWSGITWLFYAALLHERLTVGWRGRRAAVMSIIGFAVILFTLFGVNFLLKGHHGDFTKW